MTPSRLGRKPPARQTCCSSAPAHSWSPPLATHRCRATRTKSSRLSDTRAMHERVLCSSPRADWPLADRLHARSQFAERVMSPNLNLTRNLGALTLVALSVACSKKSDSAADTAAVAVVAPDTSAAVAVTAAPGGPVSLTV